MPDKAAIDVASVAELDEHRVIKPVLHHVNLKTRRLQEMIDWYSLVLGGDVHFQTDTIAFLSNDDANHRIALVAMAGLVDDEDKITRTGMHHSAFEYETLDDLLASFLRLKAVGVVPGASLDHGLTMSFYYVDPDGNSVEMQADNHGDWTESTSFMRSDPRFLANPIGEFVEPDALVEARRAGVSAREVHERAYTGEYPAQGPVDLRLPS